MITCVLVHEHSEDPVIFIICVKKEERDGHRERVRARERARVRPLVYYDYF